MNNKVEKEFDFNAGSDLKIGAFDYGTTLIRAKLLKESYYCLVTKDISSATFEVWNDLGELGTFSKYDKESDLVSISVKTNASITRKVMNNLKEISHAQSVLWDFRREGITSEFL